MIRLWPVQQAVYSKLSGDSTLMSMVTAIADQPDQDQAFPYITLGEASGTPDDLLNATGSQQTLTLHAWDRGTSMSTVKQVLDRMVVTLHDAQLSISGTQAVRCQVEMADVFREGDGEDRHGVMRVRVSTFG
jgi:hypothetical protein